MKHSIKFIFSIACALLLCFCLLVPCTTGYAQTADSVATATAHLDATQWKAVEGIFQSAGNADLHVQFTAKKDTLLAKLLWNNNLIHLLPSSPVSFTSIEAEDHGPIHVTFNKDSAGELQQVNVADNGIWNRTKNYKPIVKKEMPHTPAQLKQFEGLYQFQNDPNRFIQFSEKENKLVLKQHWDGNEIIFVPDSALSFFSREVPQFALSFIKGKEGSIEEAVAFKRDRWKKIKKSVPSPQDLKTFEGKYQFKDDPDNYIQLTTKGNSLVVKQLWDGKEITVEPQTATYFYNNTQAYPLQVIKDKDGVVIQVQTLESNLFNKVK